MTAEAVLPAVLPAALPAALPAVSPAGGWHLATPDEIARAEAAARLRGAAEALDMLGTRPFATRQRAGRYGAALLLRHAAPADWSRSGLPVPEELPSRQPGRGTPKVPVSDSSVMRLAAVSMNLYCTGLRAADQPWHWAQLAQFFTRHVPVRDPGLAELRAKAAGTVR